jgi:hypothetical protein
MVQGNQPACRSERQGIPYHAFIEGKEPGCKNKNQGKEENPLIPAQDAGGKLHYFAEKQASQC